MTTEEPWTYSGTLVRCLDGDTCFLRVEREVDFGFRRQMRLSSVEEFRLLGLDAPELHGPTRAMGEAALARLRYLLSDCNLCVKTLKSDQYGRWLATIYLVDVAGKLFGSSVNDRMIGLGYARAYDGKGARLPWDPAAPYPLVRP
jgi:endonuclease YncB( thermonuclease family)